MSFLQSYGARKAENPQAVDVNEDGVIDAHDKAYNQGQAGNLSTNAMGQAAAMQVRSTAETTVNRGWKLIGLLEGAGDEDVHGGRGTATTTVQWG